MKMLYRLYLLIFGPIVFIIAGLLVILQIITSPLVWLFTGKWMFCYDPIGVNVLKKFAPEIYDYLDSLVF